MNHKTSLHKTQAKLDPLWVLNLLFHFAYITLPHKNKRKLRFPRKYTYPSHEHYILYPQFNNLIFETPPMNPNTPQATGKVALLLNIPNKWNSPKKLFQINIPLNMSSGQKPSPRSSPHVQDTAQCGPMNKNLKKVVLDPSRSFISGYPLTPPPTQDAKCNWLIPISQVKMPL